MTYYNNKKLPDEVLKQIFRYLPKKEKKECQFVCRSWYQPAKQEFYRKVTITGHQSGLKLLSCLEQTGANTGLYIKCVTIELPEGVGRQNKRLLPLKVHDGNIRFFKCCPNLVKICLKGLNPYLTLLTLRYKIDNGIHLENLSEINIIDDRNGIAPSSWPHYYKANLAFTQSIKSLVLINSPANIGFFNAKQGGVYNYLSQFHNLTKLSIQCTVDLMQKDATSVVFPRILSTCPKLKKVSLLADKLDIKEDDLLSTEEYANLKTLKLNVARVTATDIKYVITTFPNLESFYVELWWYPHKWKQSKENNYVISHYKKYSKRLKHTNFNIDEIY